MAGATNRIVNRTGGHPVALETTLLVHGIPRESAPALAEELGAIIRDQGATPATVGIVSGRAIVGLTDDELGALLAAPSVEKINRSNLGVALHGGSHGATTVSSTMELAAEVGVRVFATGGIGGVHKGFAHSLDISSDLLALAEFPVAVVTSGVKSLLDICATREVLETLAVPVVGYRTDSLPAFYMRDSAAGVDARFDDADKLASFIESELTRTGRGIVVCNPIPEQDEIDGESWHAWLETAESRVRERGVSGRDVTPAVLGELHEVSRGATLRANLALVRSNAALAGTIASLLPQTL
jgi:pseudouridine-5'-phosphate glycosidase